MKSYIIGGMLLLGLSLASCDKKELCMRVHPHDKRICNTTFTLNIDPSYTNDEDLSTDSDLYSGDYAMRYTAEIWSVDESGNLDTKYERLQFVGDEYKGEKIVEVLENVMLPALDLRLMIWADPIDPTGGVEPSFNVDNLQAVKMTEVGNTIGKDGFTITKDLDFDQYMYELKGVDVDLSLDLERAFGRHRVIANDLEAFLEENETIPDHIVVDYQFYVATEYNCALESLQSAEMGHSYTFKPIVLSDNYLVIAEDYLFISPKSTNTYEYYVIPTAYNAEGEAINLINTIAVPNRLNTTELVYGSFLTDESNARPGIDDSFDDDIVLEFDDDGNLIVPDVDTEDDATEDTDTEEDTVE